MICPYPVSRETSKSRWPIALAEKMSTTRVCVFFCPNHRPMSCSWRSVTSSSVDCHCRAISRVGTTTAVLVCRAAMTALAMTVFPAPGCATNMPSRWRRTSPTATSCSFRRTPVNVTGRAGGFGIRDRLLTVYPADLNALMVSSSSPRGSLTSRSSSSLWMMRRGVPYVENRMACFR